MTHTKLTPIIEQFGLFDGKWERNPHNQTAVREPKSMEIPKGNLFALVEVQGDINNLDVVEKHLVALIRDTYYPAQGGITASLRRAIQTANQWLYQQNAATERNKRLIAGVVAVVMREDDLYVAQVGPAALFSNLSNFVARYPKQSTWLDMALPSSTDSSPALGHHQFAEPNITHLQLQANDVLVLADARLAAQLPVDIIAEATNGHKVDTISKKLVKVSQARQCSALIIQVTSAKNGASPTINIVKQVPQAIKQPQPATPLAQIGQRFNLTLPAVFQGEKGPKTKAASTSAPKPTPKPSKPPTSPPPITSRPVEPEIYPFDQVEEPEWEETTPPPHTRRTQEGSFSIGRTWQMIMGAFLGTIGLLGSGLHTILKLVLPGNQAQAGVPRQAGLQAQPLTQKQPSYQALKYVAIGIPLVVLLITALMYLYKGYSQEQQYDAALLSAQKKFEQAQIAVPDVAHGLLNEVEQHLNEAETIQPDQTEVAALRISIEDQRDQISAVQRLYYVPELRRYTDPGTQLSQVIVQGIEVYVLDTGLNRVYQHTLDDIGDTILPDQDSPMLLSQGQEVDSLFVGDLFDLVWMPAGGSRQTSDLLILQQKGLFEYNPNWGATALSIGGASSWVQPIAADSYFGNFYLLDQGANQVYRYFPTENGYENPPEPYFTADVPVNLSNTVDIAIDGAIYILHQDGRIEKFLSGQPAVFSLNGLDIPFKNPVSIYTAPDEIVQYLYVADAGNQRIVQLTKEGQFVRQFKPRVDEGVAFDNLQAIYVDEIGQKMYVLNGNSLYAPNIPLE